MANYEYSNKKMRDKGMSERDAMLVSMKMSNKDTEPTPAKPSEESYPYGLCLDLNEDVIDKLGINVKDVGDTCRIVADAKVKRVSEEKSDGETRRSMALQITKMSLDPANGDNENADEPEVEDETDEDKE